VKLTYKDDVVGLEEVGERIMFVAAMLWADLLLVAENSTGVPTAHRQTCVKIETTVNM
jgi:hypothetical protein